MEIRETYTVIRDKKLIRLSATLHQWFKEQADRQERSVNAEMSMALEHWRKIHSN